MSNKIAVPISNIFRIRDTHQELADWRDGSEFIDLEQSGRRGRLHLQVSVAGYWSTDVINVCLTRQQDWRNETVEWKPEMSHSSGGRLTEAAEAHYPAKYFTAIESDLVAESNFGYAMMTVAGFVQQLVDYVPVLEQFYQQELKDKEMVRSAQEVKKQAAIDADPPMGEARAKQLYAEATSNLDMWSTRRIKVFSRGQDDFSNLVIARRHNITHRYLSGVISRARALEVLAKSSARSRIE